MAVSIYDGTRRLARYLRSETYSRRLENVSRAETLYGVLEEVSREAHYPELVEGYRQAAGMLREERRAGAGEALAGVQRG
jgi:hypothetical protein